MVQGFCVKCKKKVEIADAKEVIMHSKRGDRRAIQGKCPYCGTKVFRILGKA